MNFIWLKFDKQLQTAHTQKNLIKFKIRIFQGKSTNRIFSLTVVTLYKNNPHQINDEDLIESETSSD